uniref:Uncharacterized protein n=1 Tax=Anopheles maculatus TaxID=74869 RepID=A0A182SLP0_9DIPT
MTGSYVLLSNREEDSIIQPRWPNNQASKRSKWTRAQQWDNAITARLFRPRPAGQARARHVAGVMTGPIATPKNRNTPIPNTINNVQANNEKHTEPKKMNRETF